MVKKVVSNDMVAHLWANQSQDDARNSSGSVSFVGDVFYSYRTPVAMLHETNAGRVALITSDGYSVTTRSKHLGPAWCALRGVVAQSFRVPYVGAFGGMAPSRAHSPDEWHAVNVSHLADEYRELGARILRAVWTYHTDRASVERALREAAERVALYCDLFKIKKAARPALDPADDARAIWARRAERDARRNTPAAIAKRERAKELKAARDTARLEREQRERFEHDTKMREAFRAGGIGNTAYYARPVDEHGGALLRVDPDGMVRTSLGAECPHDDARRAFALIARARERGEAWQPEGVAGVKLGSFALNEIRADGSIRAGCHTINWPEIQSAACALGLLA